jgi:hypothetical protein
MTALILEALDGSNPLGFLSALGTLMVAHAAGETEARLSWERRARWVPVLHAVSVKDPAAFAEVMAGALAGRTVTPHDEKARGRSEKAFNQASTLVKKKRNEIKARRLRGDERREALEREVAPLEGDRDARRKAWLEALARAVPRPELALGKKIDCRPEEFRQHAAAFVTKPDAETREALDLLAAFGSDAVYKSGSITPTPFCFIRGTGHQYFLDTVRQLLQQATPEKVHEALFEQRSYRDLRLSMRWDPMDDRQYALMDRDPSKLKTRTVWMANLLAYRALTLFPTAPRGRRLEATGWNGGADEPSFSWPLWRTPLPPSVIRSLLQLRLLVEDSPDRPTLRARGITAVCRTRRIKVGAGSNYKLNFAPARAVWSS